MLSPDTQATLLLTGRFSRNSEARPLTLAEYNRLAKQLHDLQLRPADLLKEIPSSLVADLSRLENLLSRGTALALAVERWERSGIVVIGRSDEGYPVQFRKKLRSAAAPILYVAGPPNFLETESVCVVGSRNASPSGLEFAARIGQQCAEEKLAVVSGDARGVDRTAMEAALQHGGRVTAVLSDSLSRAIVIKRNRSAIAGGQLVLMSPFDPDASFSIANAMDRNKYLYALGSLALIVDSELKGGTWSGALENARHQWTKAYVRVAADAPPGNQKLAEQGIPAFPETLASLRDIQASMPEVTLLSAMENTEQPHVRKAPEVDPPADAIQNSEQPSTHQSLFDTFVTRLTALLAEEPKTEVAIADHFELERVQVKAWLERAQRESRVMKLMRPTRYSAVNGRPNIREFELPLQ